jgi:hypothetical protein
MAGAIRGSEKDLAGRLDQIMERLDRIETRLPSEADQHDSRCADRSVPAGAAMNSLAEVHGCHSRCHCTRDHSARRERTGWTTHPT